MGEAVRIKAIEDNEASLTLTGLDCPDCAAKVEKAVRRMPGILEAHISFPAGRLQLQYEENMVTLDQVAEKVRKLGYGLQSEPKSQDKAVRTASFSIAGLDCADCAAKLEKRVAKVTGVERASVNFGASKMTVTYNGTEAEILQVIQKMGYSGKVELPGAKIAVRDSFWKTNQYARPTAISAILLLIALAARYLAGVPETAVNALFLAGIVLGGFLPARNGISVLLTAREFDMNLLMTIAVIGASAIGQFTEAAVVVFLFSFGNALQGYTLDKTRNSIRALMELAPNEALVRRGMDEMVLPVEQIITGDLMIVRPGERIAMDGIVAAGTGTVNQAPITGESLPVLKQEGDEIFAGTINERGALEIKVTRLAADNTISRIIAMVEEAQGQRAPSQQFIDRFAKYYTPAVMAVAALVAVVPPLFFGGSFDKWFYEAMALLLVGCPCALVISTPVSIVSAIGNAAKNGVLIKGGMYLEAAGAISVVALDKTGTLTEGRPKVTEIIPMDGFDEDELLMLAAAIESRSEHPLADAVVRCAREQRLEIPGVDQFESFIGKGAQGWIQGQLLRIGNTRLFEEQGLIRDQTAETVRRLQDQGKTVMLLGDSDRIIGVIAVADSLRDQADRAVLQLKKAGIKKVLMLTGDNRKTAGAIAEKVGLDGFEADLMPEDKVAAVNRLLTEYGRVAMVGDGVNDAPAMAAATVGIAMGAIGTDTALETADITLMADDLSKLSYVVRLSRKTLNVIKQNIILALLVKFCILLLVVPGWLTLWLAVAADMGSSLLVTVNGMRLLRVKH